jgi:hypothetical protein
MNLNDEYVLKQKIYSQQKEYRQTPEGKLALRRANERQLLKRMLKVNEVLECHSCGESDFTLLTPVGEKILCYNHKYKRQNILENEL